MGDEYISSFAPTKLWSSKMCALFSVTLDDVDEVFVCCWYMAFVSHAKNF